jgi:two-component system sensor histidine kinase RegB
MMRTSTVQPNRHAINFAWLMRLRWGSVLGQAATIAGARLVYHARLPVAALAAVVASQALTNLACVGFARRRADLSEWHVGAVMVLDVLLLTVVLGLSGGQWNPFCFLYLVQIALAAVVLTPRWTWALVALSLACFGALFAAHLPLEMPARTHDEHMRVHLEGMWVAFGVAASFIVYFLMRVLRALGERDAELARAREVATRQERLAALATLAGGAAHELATPLGTIATVAKELERQLAAQAGAAEDVRLIRSEVERCRRILEQMSAHAGEITGEGLARVTLAELARDVTAELASSPAVTVEVADAGALELRPRALAQALRVLVKNAQDASPPGEPVTLRLAADADALVAEVRDHGAGMPPDVLARAGEPFFTTKPPGAGMGLGLFLARAVIERLGGSLSLESSARQGTTARVRVPIGAAATIRRIGAGAS